jgi:TetR/AcrR family transcriptional repressor of mexJK operon
MTATRRTKSREKILTAAEGLFLAGGYHGTAMDAVTEAAGVSKQTVYAHFPSKEALFAR